MDNKTNTDPAVLSKLAFLAIGRPNPANKVQSLPNNDKISSDTAKLNQTKQDPTSTKDESKISIPPPPGDKQSKDIVKPEVQEGKNKLDNKLEEKPQVTEKKIETQKKEENQGEPKTLEKRGSEVVYKRGSTSVEANQMKGKEKTVEAQAKDKGQGQGDEKKEKEGEGQKVQQGSGDKSGSEEKKIERQATKGKEGESEGKKESKEVKEVKEKKEDGGKEKMKDEQGNKAKLEKKETIKGDKDEKKLEKQSSKVGKDEKEKDVKEGGIKEKEGKKEELGEKQKLEKKETIKGDKEEKKTEKEAIKGEGIEKRRQSKASQGKGKEKEDDDDKEEKGELGKEGEKYGVKKEKKRKSKELENKSLGDIGDYEKGDRKNSKEDEETREREKSIKGGSKEEVEIGDNEDKAGKETGSEHGEEKEEKSDRGSRKGNQRPSLKKEIDAVESHCGTVMSEEKSEGGVETREGEGEEVEVELKKKIEKIVAEKMEKEVDKIVEKKVEMIMKKKKVPPKSEFEKLLEAAAKSKDGTAHLSDKYLFAGPSPNEIMMNSTLAKHTRFWEVERKIQEHKEKYIRRIGNSSPKEQQEEKRYVYTIRDRLTSLPPIVSNMSHTVDRSFTPNDNSMLNYTDSGEDQQNKSCIPLGEKDDMKGSARPTNANAQRARQVKKANEAKVLAKAQVQQKQGKNDMADNMPRIYETYVGKNFTQNMMSKVGSSQVRASHKKKTKSLGIARVVSQGHTERKEYKIVGHNSHGGLELVEGSGGIFLTEEQLKGMSGSKQGVSASTQEDYLNTSEQMSETARNPGKIDPSMPYMNSYNQSNVYKKKKERDSRIMNTYVQPNSRTPNNVPANRGSNLLSKGNTQSKSPMGFGSSNSRINTVRKEMDKKNNSAIMEVSDSNRHSDARANNRSQESSRSRKGFAPSIQRIDSGSLIRQYYKIRAESRGTSNSDTEDRNNMTVDGRRSQNFIGKLLRERTRSGDHAFNLGQKGSGFTTTQRTTMIEAERSPGPKYNLSSYKSLVGAKGLNLEEYNSSHMGKTPLSRLLNNQNPMVGRDPGESFTKDSGRYSSVRTGRITTKYTPGPRIGLYKADTPGPGEYNMPSMQSKNGVQFSRQRKSIGSAFPKTNDITEAKRK